MMRPPDRDKIYDALRRIDPVFLDTPLRASREIDERLGCRILFKDETANPIRSFKGRGAAYLLASLPTLPTELVCASAGNFGQGLAHAAARRGCTTTVFAAEIASPVKIAAMRALGAAVRLAGADFDHAKEAARAYAAARGALFVEDGAHPEIAEGAGTLALEATRAGHGFDRAVVPLGNGSLVTGVALWLKSLRRETRITAVCAAGAPAMALSWREGRPVETASADTIADGIAVRIPVPYALAHLAERLDEVVLVPDDRLLEAMRLLHRGLGLTVEPAGAAGLAAVLNRPEAYRGERLLIPLCGGNLTREQARRWLGPTLQEEASA